MERLAELLRQGADRIVNLPTETQRFVTNPQAFVQLLTGKNPLPRETGFAAGATGLPPQQGTILNPEYQAYMQGYEQGEPVSIAAMATPAAVPLAKALAPKAGQMAEQYMVNQGFMPSIVAYHGTPHKIVGKFDINKVGTGEGAQAYGHGMYFAEAPQVAETYKRAGGGLEVRYPKPLEELGINPKVVTHSMDWDENPVNQALGRIVKGLRTTALDYPDVPVDQKLIKEHFDEYIRLLEDKYPAEAAQKKALQEFVAKEGYPEISFGGNLYKVDIPDEYIPNMLDWDKPIGQQSKELQKAIEKTKKFVTQQDLDNLGGDLSLLYNKDLDVNRFLNTWSDLRGKANAGEELLSQVGIKGIRYLDEGSRGAGKGTSNFVVFDPSSVQILEENAKPIARKELIKQEIEKLTK
jgi:hypothetical protein